MMRLDTDPMKPGRKAERMPAEGLAILIQVPRVAEPRERVRAWRLEDASRTARPAWCSPSRSAPTGGFRAAARPRRRLRRGVRRAGWSVLFLISMASTFTIGWTTRGGDPRWPASGLAAMSRQAWAAFPAPEGRERPSAHPAPQAEAESFATGPALGAPVADAEIPVILPGYVLPDDNREEPAHEGS